MNRVTQSAAPSGGFLVGVKNFACNGDAVAGDQLHLSIRKTGHIEALHIFEGSVVKGAASLASGEFRCFVTSATQAAATNQAVAFTGTFSDCIRSSMRVVSSTGAEICFQPDAAVFAGHLPGQPVVPGVVWIEAALKLFQEAVLREVVSARFKKTIRPGDHVRLEINSAQQGVFNALLRMDHTIVASMELSLETK
jgi:3-hydroxymyristoyl/3-hydroxydecanoyl-(acyl carrier protein) dehydratase